MAKRHYDLALATNTEAYFPVTLSLIKLRIRKFWHTTILRDHKHGVLQSWVVKACVDMNFPKTLHPMLLRTLGLRGNGPKMHTWIPPVRSTQMNMTQFRSALNPQELS